MAEDGSIEAEIARVFALLRGFGEANRSFVRALDRAREDLAESLKAEQVRLVISYLVIENDRMRARSANLQAGLEQSQRQIESLKSNLVAVEAQGLSDPLTGLKNRRSFDVVLASQVVAARASGEPLSLILADIDHFKEINDRHGHAVGDEVLVALAKRCKSRLREIDACGRLGGEEFVVLLPETGAEGARATAERLRCEVGGSPVATSDGPVRVTISVGVALHEPSAGVAAPSATSGRGARAVQALLEQADRALYRAKDTGRDRVVMGVPDEVANA
jgi:diguanylate cyclase